MEFSEKELFLRFDHLNPDHALRHGNQSSKPQIFVREFKGKWYKKYFKAIFLL